MFSSPIIINDQTKDVLIGMAYSITESDVTCIKKILVRKPVRRANLGALKY